MQIKWEEVVCQLPESNVVRAWCSPNPTKPVVILLHGNGFCGRLYEPMLAPFATDYELLLLDIPGHGRSDPVAKFPGWNALSECCYRALEVYLRGRPQRPAIAVGHSLGAVLLTLMAAEHKHAFQRMILLDPIFFPPRLLITLRIFKMLRLLDRFHPLVQVTRNRRRNWPSRDSAIDYLSGRGIYRHWHSQAKSNYVDFAMRPIDSTSPELTLCCDPELEAKIFASVPRELWRSIKSVQVPMDIFMGNETFAFARRSAQHAAQINSAIQCRVTPGGHCFMLDDPPAATALLRQSLSAS